eukprot:TRINITY_DN856_c0_g1_i1.p1 TRINITY_DN856_c0_g1~~TRINITY_DN856_c0_g1_i1.p1  ORF type:complete len:355 (+),score=84.44 TRINITY_DN856_c0_g1_i1:105-1169(+)
MIIYLKKLSGEQKAVDVDPAAPVSGLVAQARDAFSIPSDLHIIFLSSGRQLDEDRSLQDQSVNKQATVHLVTRAAPLVFAQDAPESVTDRDRGGGGAAAAAAGPSSSVPAPSASASSSSSSSSGPRREPRGVLPTFPTSPAERLRALVSPIARECGMLYCLVARERRQGGSDRFTMGLQGATASEPPTFLLAIRKADTNGYLITADPGASKQDRWDESGPLSAGKVNCLNRLEFSCVGPVDGKGSRPELAGVAWTTGSKSRAPKVSVALPSLKGGPPLVLRNTPPTWHGETKTFRLNFGGRVKKASVKNFQLESAGVVHLTFGKVADDLFVLDFLHPLSPVQALSIAIPAFDIL